MHSIPALSTLSSILNTLQPAGLVGLKKAANPKASTGATTGTSSTSNADGGLGTTFLNLLSTELQNQDPTAPVDSTEMVGQMISLNQLDQLISINQVLGGSTSGLTGSTQPASGAAATHASLASPSPDAAPINQLPFNPQTMMPVNPALNPAPMSSSTTSNHTSGGK